MVNEKQLLEACYSTMRYYEKKYNEASNNYDKNRYMKKLAELDMEIYDLEHGKRFDYTFWGYKL